jgi:hypothetical protein
MKGKMVGSFGPYCIFQFPDGFYVRLETLFSTPKTKSGVGRRYRTINGVPVATEKEAGDIIDQCLALKGGHVP